MMPWDAEEEEEEEEVTSRWVGKQEEEEEEVVVLVPVPAVPRALEPPLPSVFQSGDPTLLSFMFVVRKLLFSASAWLVATVLPRRAPHRCNPRGETVHGGRGGVAVMLEGKGRWENKTAPLVSGREASMAATAMEAMAEAVRSACELPGKGMMQTTLMKERLGARGKQGSERRFPPHLPLPAVAPTTRTSDTRASTTSTTTTTTGATRPARCAIVGRATELLI